MLLPGSESGRALVNFIRLIYFPVFNIDDFYALSFPLIEVLTIQGCKALPAILKPSISHFLFEIIYSLSDFFFILTIMAVIISWGDDGLMLSG